MAFGGRLTGIRTTLVRRHETTELRFSKLPELSCQTLCAISTHGPSHLETAGIVALRVRRSRSPSHGEDLLSDSGNTPVGETLVDSIHGLVAIAALIVGDCLRED